MIQDIHRAPVTDIPPPGGDLVQVCAYCEMHVPLPCSAADYERCENFNHAVNDDERRH